jgi:hypothetical protein
MVNLWKSIRRQGAKDYELGRLIDARRRDRDRPEAAATNETAIICDIDKTYLETEFESVARMVRIAFEAPGDKITVAGASDVLEACRWLGRTKPRHLHFVSSSPPQLRAVLEEKLMMDGLDWTSDTFKNQAYNLRRGRMDLLRQHVAYKSLAILRLIATAAAADERELRRYVLIGDNAESDAYIYLGVKLVVEGLLTTAQYGEYLAAAGVEAPLISELLSQVPGPGHAEISAVLIRNVPGYRFVPEAPLTDTVQLFDDFYQAALLLAVHGLLPPQAIWPLTRTFHNQHGMAQSRLAGCLVALGNLDGLSEEIKVATTALHELAPADRKITVHFSDSLAHGFLPPPDMNGEALLARARVWAKKLEARRS